MITTAFERCLEEAEKELALNPWILESISDELVIPNEEMFKLYAELSRRDFLKFAGASGVGLATLPLLVSPAEAQWQQTLLPWVWKFVGAMGMAVVTGLVTDYVKTLPFAKNWLGQQIQDTNRMMGNAGFTDLSRSQVAGRNGAIVYPALRKDKSGNVCVAVHNEKAPIPQTARPTIEGPSAIGLGMASERMRQRFGSSPVVKQATMKSLLPVRSIRKTATSLDTSYPQAELHETENGTVGFNYVYKPSENIRTVSVTAVRSNPREIILEENYDISKLA